MAKKFILMGILVLSLVFAMTVIACGGGDDTPVIFPVTPPDVGGNDGGNTGGSGGGDGGNSGGAGGDGTQPFTSLYAFRTWLAGQPTNDAATAYIVKLNVANLIGFGTTLTANDIKTKYVNLDFSGSTFTFIDTSAFGGCKNLTVITIPNSVTSIGGSAFSGCTNLTSVTIPASVTSIGIIAFSWCNSLTAINVDSSNTAYSSQDGVLYNKNKTFLHTYPEGKTGSSFTIPNSVTSIGGGAFDRCTSLTSVTIPNSVTSIESNAFIDCTSLTSVTIPNSVTSIGQSAFANCTRLASVTFAGTIPSSEFPNVSPPFLGDLRDKFYATDSTNGTPGTYTTTAPVSRSSVWTKKI